MLLKILLAKDLRNSHFFCQNMRDCTEPVSVQLSREKCKDSKI